MLTDGDMFVHIPLTRGEQERLRAVKKLRGIGIGFYVAEAIREKFRKEDRESEKWEVVVNEKV